MVYVQRNCPIEIGIALYALGLDCSVVGSCFSTYLVAVELVSCWFWKCKKADSSLTTPELTFGAPFTQNDTSTTPRKIKQLASVIFGCYLLPEQVRMFRRTPPLLLTTRNFCPKEQRPLFWGPRGVRGPVSLRGTSPLFS